MLKNDQLLAIDRKDWILQDVCLFGDSLSGSKGHVVLTDDFLAWRPMPYLSLFPWFSFPKEFFVIPLNSIARVDVQVDNCGLRKTLRIHCQKGIGETDIIEMQVGFVHRWVSALKTADITVSGGETANLTSVKGLLNDYGWYFYYGFLFLAMMGSNIVWQFFHPDRNNIDFFLISIAVFYLINTVVGLGVLWKSSIK